MFALNEQSKKRERVRKRERKEGIKPVLPHIKNTLMPILIAPPPICCGAKCINSDACN